MSLVVFTALVGMVIAPTTIHPVIGFAALLCIAIGAGASGALNMWFDADIDGHMLRTKERPIPAGRVPPAEALTFGATLSVLAVLAMGLMVNYLAAAILAVTIGFYVFVYTMWLKRRTPQNIVIGGAAGAFPPLIGWAVATGGLSIEPIVLFAIIFLWTPPHFWALALTRVDEFKAAGVPMMPVVSGSRSTRNQIFVYSLLLGAASMAPVFVGMAGWTYAILAHFFSAVFVAMAGRLALCDDDEKKIEKASKTLFGFSIIYLFVLFAALMVEKLAGLGPI
jgi:protoheme IX farnesyltransferase